MVQNDTYLQTLYPHEQVNPASVDLTLGSKAVIHDWPWYYRLLWYLTKNERWRKRKRQIDISQGYFLKPGEMALLHSREWVRIPTGMSALLTLKSSRGREGLDHALAGWFDPGFEGEAVFEVYAHAHPVRLQEGLRFAQLIYLETLTPAASYNGHYMHQTGPQGSWTE